MSEKKENYETNAHLHDDEKVESPDCTKPVDSPDVIGVKPLGDSASCDHSNNNGERGKRDSEKNPCLDSVLEYANRIRAFVGLEEDDSKELPPPPLPKPLILDNIERANVDEPYVILEDIDREFDSTSTIENPETRLSVTPNAVQNRDLSSNEHDCTDDYSDKSNSIGNQDAGLCMLSDIPDDSNININDSDFLYEDSIVQNPDESLPVIIGSVIKEPGFLENMDSGFVDELLTTALFRNSVDNIDERVEHPDGIADNMSVQLKNDTYDQSMPFVMVNNGYTEDKNINEDESEVLDNKNSFTEVQLDQSSNGDLKMDNQTENVKEKKNNESEDTTVNLETDFQYGRMKSLDIQEEMKGIDNTGFENDIPTCSSKKTNEDVTKPNSSTSTQICDDKSATADNQTENQHLNDTILCKTAEVFLFDPEYVKELQNECQPTEDEVKQVPDMAVLRRLSIDVVNKVLDDAGNEIREILDERKRSTIELNDLVSNSELLCHTFPDENISETPDLNTDTDKIENGRLPAYADGSSNASEKNPKQLSNIKQNEIPIKDVLAKTYDFHDFQKKIENEMNKFDSRYDVDPDTVCGIGSFTPQWIQKFATPESYLILYSIVGMLSGCYYTYLIGTISTLEKRFAFKSKVSGTIMMVDEITPLFLGVLIGYFGGKSHRPRMVGLGMFLSAICCFVSALPYFIYGPATHLNVLNVKNETNTEICGVETRQENCDSDDRPPTLAAILFLMLGSFLKGFGNLAYYAVGLAYMDDNSKKKNTPMYFAVTMALRLVGPLLGFLLSSACLKFNENPFDEPGFGPEDPRWIGGWWMGFLLQGFLLLIFSIPISLFPRNLPGHKDLENSGSTYQLPNFSGLLAALKRLGKNPLFVFIVLNTIVSIFGAFGHYIMLPKYMENQFHLSASDASLYSGPPGLTAVMISTIIGGYLIWKFKPNPRILTAGMLMVEIIAALGFLILMIPQCKRVQMTNFGLTDEGLILNNACNVDCNCTSSAFTPVCGPDGRTTYFSPCYAGCSEWSNKTSSNCSCVSDSFDEQTVTEGYCAIEGCWTQTLAFLVTLPMLQLIVSLLRVSHTMILLRSIQPEDKSVALGTFETFLCAFGFIPFPVVYGAIVDSTCLVWESSCGKTGNCWFYDVDKFNYLLHGSSAGFSALSVLCLIVIFFLSGRVNNMYEDDEVTKDSKSAIDQHHHTISDTKM